MTTLRLLTVGLVTAFTALSGCTMPEGTGSAALSTGSSDADTESDSAQSATEAEEQPVTGAYKGGLRHEHTTTIGKV